MDIVSRLRQFMQYLQIANSQFADACGIPRPTLSQLLSGRNKKVSDEFITKLHDTYPQLNVLWLMFGEGSMLVDENIEISGALNAPNSAQSTTQTAGYNLFGDSIMVPKNGTEKSANQQNTGKNTPNQPKKGTPTDNPQGKVSISPSSAKKIKSIMVFYSDNSFETFTPNRD